MFIENFTGLKTSKVSSKWTTDGEEIDPKPAIMESNSSRLVRDERDMFRAELMTVRRHLNIFYKRYNTINLANSAIAARVG